MRMLLLLTMLSLAHKMNAQQDTLSFWVNPDHERISREFMHNGSHIVRVPLVIIKGDSLKDNLMHVRVRLNHVTTDDDDVQLLSDTIMLIDMSLFNDAGEITRSLDFKVHNTVYEFDEVFEIVILSGANPGKLTVQPGLKFTLYDAANWEAELDDEITAIGGIEMTSNELIIYQKGKSKKFKEYKAGMKRRDRKFHRKYQSPLVFKDESSNTREGSNTDTGATDDANANIKAVSDSTKLEKDQDGENIKENKDQKEKKNAKKDSVKCSMDTLRRDIEYIEVHVTQGRIGHIKVKIKDDPGGYYVNKGPISLTNFYKKRYYRLDYAGSDQDLRYTWICIGDILNYQPTENRHYFPTDGKYRLERANQTEPVMSNGSPVNYFEAKTYSDFQGLSGEENGLIHTEINARFVSNSNAIYRSYFTWLQYINVDLGYSKFDSQFDTLQLDLLLREDSTLILPESDLLSVIRQANGFFNIEIDLLRASKVHDAYIKVGHRVYQTRTLMEYKADTSHFVQNRTLYTPAFHLTLGGTVYANKRLTVDFSLPVCLFYTFDLPAWFNRTGEFKWMAMPQVQFSYKVSRKLNDHKRTTQLFFRFRYFDMPYAYDNNFWQTQFGLEIPLTDIRKGG